MASQRMIAAARLVMLDKGLPTPEDEWLGAVIDAAIREQIRTRYIFGTLAPTRTALARFFEAE